MREAAPDAQESIKWGFPCYEQLGLLWGLNPAKGYVRLQFFRGADLVDKDGLLEGTGKGMRHVKVRNIPKDAIRALVSEAVRRKVAG